MTSATPAFQPMIPEVTDLGRVFDLYWVDPALHTTNEPVTRMADFERHRRFPHVGAAIAWARRQIYHGKVFGEHVEMHTVFRTQRDGEVSEYVDTIIDITLPGFRTWKTVTNRSIPTDLSLGKPERKCRIERR